MKNSTSTSHVATTATCQDEIRTCGSLSAFMMSRVEALRQLAGWNPETTYEGGKARSDDLGESRCQWLIEQVDGAAMRRQRHEDG